jgi:hypothetical protein
MSIVLTALRLLVAAFFVFMALKNLTGDEAIAADFDRWGYPAWFRAATALLQLLGAAALLWKPASFFGAALLACIMVGALVTHALHDPPRALLSPAAFLAVIGVFLFVYRPQLLR